MIGSELCLAYNKLNASLNMTHMLIQYTVSPNCVQIGLYRWSLAYIYVPHIGGFQLLFRPLLGILQIERDQHIQEVLYAAKWGGGFDY